MSRFWNKVKKTQTCWLWLGARDPDGYGKFKISRKVLRAHRIAYALAFKIPFNFPGIILHKCDTPSCVRPSHLTHGTHQDNMTDMLHKGRHKTADQKGESNGNAKLTLDEVLQIKKLIAQQHTNKSIAKLFGVTHQTVSRIKRGKSWKT
jgi:hypothetical protein